MPELHVIDLNYLGSPGSIASYVITTPEGAVMIECGPASSQEAMERELGVIGLTPDDVKHVFVTHIHLDHAGAAGWWGRRGAQIHAHAFGATHLVDPSRLLKSATRIYGELMDTLWGEILPVPEDRIRPCHDGDVVDACGLELEVIETPGHARHHHAFAVTLDGERLVFCGDAAAALATEAPEFISMPAPPPEFDLEQWLATLDRLRSCGADALYPTHFGRVDDVGPHLDRVAESLRAHVARVSEWDDAGLDEDAVRARYQAWFLEMADAAGLPDEKRPFYAKGSLVTMNLQGIRRYRSKLAAS